MSALAITEDEVLRSVWVALPVHVKSQSVQTLPLMVAVAVRGVVPLQRVRFMGDTETTGAAPIEIT